MDEIYKTYLRPAINQNLINSARSVIDSREHLYYPVNSSDSDNDDEDEKSSSFLPLTDDCKLIISSYNEKNVLEDSFRTIIERHRNNRGVENKKIIDVDGTELSFENLVKKYFSNSEPPFHCDVIHRFFYNNVLSPDKERDSLIQIAAINNLRYSQQILVRQQHYLANEDQDTIQVEPSTSTEVKENTNGLDLAKHSQIPMDLLMKVDKFFTLNYYPNGHGLEESICKPLIRKNEQFYECILHRVQNIHLSEIESHIKLKDPEEHKAELLRLLNEKENDKGAEN